MFQSTDIHVRSLDRGATLSRLQVARVISPFDVIKVLNAASVRFVLVGAHGLSGWMQEPRATQDVDIVVMNKHLKKATTALLAAWLRLEARDLDAVVRLADRESGEVAIDILKQ